jgi:stage II sporulation protein D
VTGTPWACAALLVWHLSSGGALPKEVRPAEVRSCVTRGQPVRILIFAGSTSISVRPQAAADLEDGETHLPLAAIAAGALVTLRPSGGKVAARGRGVQVSVARLIIRSRTANAGAVVSGAGGWGTRGLYSGPLEVVARGGRLRVIEHAPLETYVAGVVAAETPSWFPLEALKAQAIAARTYALFHLGDHAQDEADLCSRVHCQVYDGQPSRGAPAAEAARQTAGQVLTWNGVLVDALYHSACGGATARAWQVRQGKLLPYLRGGDDTYLLASARVPYCAREHDLQWTRRLSWASAQRLVKANLGAVLGRRDLSPGRLTSLAVTRTPAGHRAAWLELVTSTGTYRVRGDAIRWLFGRGYAGGDGLRSTAFQLTVERDRRGVARAVLFHGVGHGHGIGLCQWGARGRAAAGQSASEILAAYYPGAVILDLARPSSPGDDKGNAQTGVN